MKIIAVLGAFLAGLALQSSLSAQKTLTIPKEYAFKELGASSATLFQAFPSGNRSQFVYDSSHFTDQGINGGITIHKLRWRAKGLPARAWNGGSFSNVTIKMATSRRHWHSLSSNFALNVGTDYRQVYKGKVVIRSQFSLSSTPGPWYVEVALAQPFNYVPQSGKDLVIELFFQKKSWSSLLDHSTGPEFAQGPKALASSVIAPSPVAASGTPSRDWAPVIQVDYTTGGGTFADFSVTQRTGNKNLQVTFVSTSKTSNPRGLASYLWDFGDGSPPAIGIAASHVYTCGSFSPSLTITDASFRKVTKKTAADFIEAGVFDPQFTQDKVSGASPLQVRFTDTTPSTVKWLWSFEGGATSSLRNPIATFTQPGWHDVSYEVTSACNVKVVKIIRNAVYVYPAGRKCLSTNFVGNQVIQSNNAGSLFDIEVKNPKGIKITELEVASAAPELRNFALRVYVTPNSYKNLQVPGTPGARDNQRGKWSLVATASGRSKGNLLGKRTVVNISDFFLPPGKWGMFIVYTKGGMFYSRGTGTNQTYSNADLTLSLGSVKSTPFSGGVFEPQVWNGTICYAPDNDAAVGRIGYGCPGSNNKIPQMFLSSRPVIGSTIRLSITDMPSMGGLAVLLVGTRAREIDLAGLGAPNCSLHFDTMFSIGIANNGGGYGTSFVVPPVVSGTVLMQAGVLDTQANTLGISTSVATAMRAGN